LSLDLLARRQRGDACISSLGACYWCSRVVAADSLRNFKFEKPSREGRETTDGSGKMNCQVRRVQTVSATLMGARRNTVIVGASSCKQPCCWKSLSSRRLAPCGKEPGRAPCGKTAERMHMRASKVFKPADLPESNSSGYGKHHRAYSHGVSSRRSWDRGGAIHFNNSWPLTCDPCRTPRHVNRVLVGSLLECTACTTSVCRIVRSGIVSPRRACVPGAQVHQARACFATTD
jgi:hypothetical protein